MAPRRTSKKIVILRSAAIVALAVTVVIAFTARGSDEVIDGYVGHVRALHFNRDASIVATASWELPSRFVPLKVSNGQPVEVVKWSTTDRTAISKIQIPSTEVIGVAFAPDLSIVALLERKDDLYEGRLKLLDANTGKLLRQSVTKFSQGFLKFSPDGRQLFQDDLMWNTSTLKVVKTFGPHLHVPSSIAFSPQGNHVAISSLNALILCGPGEYHGPTDAVRFFDRSTGAMTGSIEGTGGKNSGVRHVRYSASGNLIAAIQSTTVDVYDVQTSEKVRSFQPIEKRKGWHRDIQAVSAVEFSSNNSMLAVAFTDKVTAELAVWNPETGRLLAMKTGFASPIHAMSFSPDSKVLACAGRTVEIFSCDPNIKTPTLNARPSVTVKDGYEWTEELAFSPDEKLIVSVADQKVTLWDSALNRLHSTRAPHVGHNGIAHALFALNQPKLLTRQTGHGFDESTLWSIDQQKVTQANDNGAIANIESGVRLTDWSGRGREVLENRVAGKEEVADEVFYRLNPTLEKLLKNSKLEQWGVPKSTSDMQRIAFHPSRPIMATASSSLLKLINVDTGVQILAVGHRSGVTSLAFSHDGTRLAVGASNGEVTIWPTDHRQQSLFQTRYAVKFLTNDEHQRVNCVRFSADDQTLATATSRGHITLWEISTGLMN